MYYPIFRGKLNELLALRELAKLENEKKFCPVIEPVKASFPPLIRTIDELNQAGIEPLVIMNPSVGDLINNHKLIETSLDKDREIKFIPTFIVHDSIEPIQSLLSQHSIYALFLRDGLNMEIITATANSKLNIISSDTAPNLINRVSNVVLYGDFFKKQKRNADYLKESPFSSLHTYFSTLNNVIGFGDYSIVGEEYSEAGGPAYVVTIHMSYINSQKFDEAFLRHYSSSYESDSPANPGKKFLDALNLFITDYHSAESEFIETEGVKQFFELNKAKHFPGLGQVKKISIMHHTETINEYLIVNG